MAKSYFAFKQREDREFIFELTDDKLIAHARRILSGQERREVHVMGKIKIGRKPYNPDWGYYLDPASVRFFHVAIEVCDAQMDHVQDHLDEAGGAFLPGYYWCPWDSTVNREVTAAGEADLNAAAGASV